MITKRLVPLAGIIAMLLSLNATAQTADAALIRALLKSYERVLNASDVDGVLELYTDDGVFMPQHNPSAVGRDQVRAAYSAVFDALELNVTFDIVEVEVIAPTWAFARTKSSGVDLHPNLTRDLH